MSHLEILPQKPFPVVSTEPEPLFVDTGYIVAIINEKDRFHAQAMRRADRFDSWPLVITDAVLPEIGNALSRIARKSAVESIHHFQTAEEATVVHLNPALFKAGLELYKSYRDKTLLPWSNQISTCVSNTIISWPPILHQWVK